MNFFFEVKQKIRGHHIPATPHNANPTSDGTKRTSKGDETEMDDVEKNEDANNKDCNANADFFIIWH